MRLSEIGRDELDGLPVAAKTRIVFGGVRDSRGRADAALVLGCGSPREMTERADAAATLLRAGRVRLLVPTGGVRHPTEFGEITEAEYMERRLRERGVPEDAILFENEARTTIENMIYGTLALERVGTQGRPFSAFVVTSAWHMRRSMALAKSYLPRTARVLSRSSRRPAEVVATWFLDEGETRRYVEREVRQLREFAAVGAIPDIVF